MAIAYDDKRVDITIENPMPPVTERRESEGNKMAMTNIQQRFELAYGSRGNVEVDDSNDRFTVTLRFPEAGEEEA